MHSTWLQMLLAMLRALRGEALPRKAQGASPAPDRIPLTHHRSTFGVVEVTRGCQFCSIALRHGTSLPLEHILESVRAQAREGADTILITTEDLFLYEQGPRFQTNGPALKRMLEAVAAVEGVKNVVVSHGTMAPVAVDKSIHQHRGSAHPYRRYFMLFIGLEAGSPRLFAQYMKGKSYPNKPEQWPEVVLKGMQILNRHNWFPFCTWIIGLPGETREDTKQSLGLLYALRDARWFPVPTLFVPLEDTRLGPKDAARAPELTDLQWGFFFTCWRYNLDFFRNTPALQWKFLLGIPIYYYTVARRLFFGPNIKYRCSVWDTFRIRACAGTCTWISTACRRRGSPRRIRFRCRRTRMRRRRLLVDPHIVDGHGLGQVDAVGRGLVGAAAGDVHDQVHGVVERPAGGGVPGVGEDLLAVEKEVHVIRVPVGAVEVELIVEIRRRLGAGAALRSKPRVSKKICQQQRTEAFSPPCARGSRPGVAR